MPATQELRNSAGRSKEITLEESLGYKARLSQKKKSGVGGKKEKLIFLLNHTGNL